MTLHVTLWLKEKKVWFLDRGREDFSDLFKHTFVFVVFGGGGLVSLITGVVIIFGIHPAVLPPSPTHCGLVDFYKVLRVN